MKEPEFITISMAELEYASFKAMMNRFGERLEKHAAAGRLRHRLDSNWAGVALNIPEIHTLVELLRLAKSGDHAPWLMPLLEELEEGMERPVIFEEVNRG